MDDFRTPPVDSLPLTARPLVRILLWAAGVVGGGLLIAGAAFLIAPGAPAVPTTQATPTGQDRAPSMAAGAPPNPTTGPVLVDGRAPTNDPPTVTAPVQKVASVKEADASEAARKAAESRALSLARTAEKARVRAADADDLLARAEATVASLQGPAQPAVTDPATAEAAPVEQPEVPTASTAELDKARKKYESAAKRAESAKNELAGHEHSAQEAEDKAREAREKSDAIWKPLLEQRRAEADAKKTVAEDYSKKANEDAERKNAEVEEAKRQVDVAAPEGKDAAFAHAEQAVEAAIAASGHAQRAVNALGSAEADSQECAEDTANGRPLDGHRLKDGDADNDGDDASSRSIAGDAIQLASSITKAAFHAAERGGDLAEQPGGQQATDGGEHGQQADEAEGPEAPLTLPTGQDDQQGADDSKDADDSADDEQAQHARAEAILASQDADSAEGDAAESGETVRAAKAAVEQASQDAERAANGLADAARQHSDSSATENIEALAEDGVDRSGGGDDQGSGSESARTLPADDEAAGASGASTDESGGEGQGGEGQGGDDRGTGIASAVLSGLSGAGDEGSDDNDPDAGSDEGSEASSQGASDDGSDGGSDGGSGEGSGDDSESGSGLSAAALSSGDRGQGDSSDGDSDRGAGRESSRGSDSGDAGRGSGERSDDGGSGGGDSGDSRGDSGGGSRGGDSGGGDSGGGDSGGGSRGGDSGGSRGGDSGGGDD